MNGHPPHPPVDCADSHVYVVAPTDESYADDARSFGISDPGGRWIIGIGRESPSVVLLGSREKLLGLARNLVADLQC